MSPNTLKSCIQRIFYHTCKLSVIQHQPRDIFQLRIFWTSTGMGASIDAGTLAEALTTWSGDCIGTGLRSVEVLLRFCLRPTSSALPIPCYSFLRGLMSVEVLLRFYLRPTSSPLPIPCYSFLRGLRSVEVLLRFYFRPTSSPFPITCYSFMSR